MSFAYRKTSAKPVDEAVHAVEEALAARRFTVLWQMDMSGTLESKGFPGHPDTRILEVCNAARANEVLRTDPDAAYLLPCRMLVRAADGGSEIGLVRPQALIAMQGGRGPIQEMAKAVEGELCAVVDDAAG